MSLEQRRDAAAILLGLVLLGSCASKPKTSPVSAPVQDAASSTKVESQAPDLPLPQLPAPPQPEAAAATSPAPQIANPEGAGTALKTADPADLARGREEREAIETSIVFGSPSSLAKARNLISKAAAMKAEDSAILDSLARGIAALAYPSTKPSAAIPSEPPRAAGLAQSLLLALGEASLGRSPEMPAEAAGNPLGELIPALVLFATDSNEASRRAFDALDRFARLGVPSIMPGLLRGIDAERRGDWQGALGLYRSVLAVAPDAWNASIGAARALLALKRSADALTLLAPLADERTGLLAFDRPYALALYANGRYSEANSYVAHVLIRDPQDSRFILIRARLLLRSKAFQQARPLLDAYGTVDSVNRLYLLLRSLESEGLRSRDEALKWARRGLSSYPDDPELLATASRILFAGPAFGREEARTLAQRAFDLVIPGAPLPGDSDSETGAVLQAARNAAGVEAARLLAIDAASRFKWADAATYLARAGLALEDKALAARILRKSGDKPRSLEFASTWYREDPASDAAAEAYIRALVDSGDDRGAQETIARLLPGTISQPLRSIFYVLQSRLQKSDEAALSLLHAALVENADNAEALAAVADIQLRRKDYAKARFYLKQAIATNPGDPELEERQRQLDAASPQ